MVEPFLNLNGKANEAIEFYEKVFNGQGKIIMFYKDAPVSPDHPLPEHLKNLVLHSEMTINGTKFHFSDTQQDVIPGNMISLAITFPTVEDVASAYKQLAADGEILMELEKTFFSPMYGWVKDKFGVGWQWICQ